MTGMQERGWWKQEVRATLALAYPLVLTNLAQALIPSTDVVLLGWAGPRVLAAGALGVNLYNACMIFGVGVMIAASPMMAKALGQRSHNVREVRRTVRQSLWAAVALVIPIWLLLWHAEGLLLLFRQDPKLAHEASHLVRPMMFGMLPLFVYQVLKSFVSALERPGWAFAVGAFAVFSNAILNYALIFGHFGLPALGLFGAGLGSTISNSVMALGLAIVVTRHKRFRRYHLFGNFWKADWPRFMHVWRLGFPIAVTLGMEVTIFNAAVFLMGLIGEPELAAHAVAIQIASLCFMVPLGIGQATTVRVGLAYGRRDRVGVTRAGWAAFAVTMAFMVALAALMLLAPRLLVGLFIEARTPADAHVVDLAVAFLTVAALFQLVDGAQAVGAGMLRGIHDTAVPMVFAALGYWVIGFGTAILFAFHLGWGGVGVWIGLAAGLATAAVLMMTRWSRREKLGLI
ncbi:MATE family efflux transporter [Sphingomonas sp. CGMCC 1.13654]|uniref:Multidrug-efflux transporter n=1 Tax=Sphingomonas chungangi TaxID=2683589 RepID=A0A838L630_9SPHN|nr:MATE family efflux transporter [Sphingomonas chungangi]MBA2934953.1 MATE family efflux transporter [Sphingomonas chungangi]MVW58264.1 MATE family efflux transporter [Sphingomonas chungangi]